VRVGTRRLEERAESRRVRRLHVSVEALDASASAGVAGRTLTDIRCPVMERQFTLSRPPWLAARPPRELKLRAHSERELR
jgi:hypothetical protein